MGGWRGKQQISTDVLSSMANNFAHSKKLKKLNLSGNLHINLPGWKSLFKYLGDSVCTLQNLDIDDTDMNNERLHLLCELGLAKNSSLTYLCISRNNNISIGGLRGFDAVFQSCHSVLKSISIGPIDDEMALLFSGFLSQDSMVEGLSSSSDYTADVDVKITQAGIEAFAKTLHNDASIMATYNSNHTLTRLSFHGSEELHADYLEKSLYLNANYIPSYVARLKILKSHFTGREEDNLKPLFDMPMELLSSAISWIGSACDNENDMKDSKTLMYQLIRRMPSLFDSIAKVKRKRTKQRKVSDYFLLMVGTE